MKANINSSILSLLGLACRAGKISRQEGSNLAAIRSGKSMLLFLASDAGKTTGKRYRDKCFFYKVPLVSFCTRAELGQALGISACTAVSINDDRFALRMKELLEQQAGDKPLSDV